MTKLMKTNMTKLIAEIGINHNGSYLEAQDFWRISGIERDVFIYAQPKVQIQDIEIITDLDKEYTHGFLEVNLDLQNHEKTNKEMYVSYQLFDTENQLIAEQQSNTAVSPKLRKTASFSTNIMRPKKWSAEHPNLYTLRIITKDTRGKLIETTERKIGFRTVEITKSPFRLIFKSSCPA